MAVTSANDSSTGGYLAPTSPPPATDDALDAELQLLIRGLTGLPGTVVYPRWQTTDDRGRVARRVPAGTNTTWCAIGVTAIEDDDNPGLIHHPEGDGSSTMRRTETIEVLASFYGPKSEGYASLVRDGLFLAQNREAIAARGMTLLDAGPVRRVPELINTNTRRRADLMIWLRRTVERTYPIRNILQGVGTITAEHGGDVPSIQTEPFAAPEN